MADTFLPKLDSTLSVAVAGSSGTVALDPSCPQVRIRWKPTTAGNDCQVRWRKTKPTDTTLVAVTTDMPVSDYPEAFSKQDADVLAVIGTGTLTVTCGHGV